MSVNINTIVEKTYSEARNYSFVSISYSKSPAKSSHENDLPPFGKFPQIHPIRYGRPSLI